MNLINYVALTDMPSINLREGHDGKVVISWRHGAHSVQFEADQDLMEKVWTETAVALSEHLLRHQEAVQSYLDHVIANGE